MNKLPVDSAQKKSKSTLSSLLQPDLSSLSSTKSCVNGNEQLYLPDRLWGAAALLLRSASPLIHHNTVNANLTSDAQRTSIRERTPSSGLFVLDLPISLVL